MLPTMDAVAALSQYTKVPDDEIPLLRAALSIALIEYPDLDLDKEMSEISSLIDGIKRRNDSIDDTGETLRSINQYLFGKLGFKGNKDDYYNPRNSLLNEVLKRKTGLPITISSIYLEVGWNLGLDLHGIGFPGHFIIGCRVNEGIKYLDPFNSGRELTEKSMQKILDDIYQGRLILNDSFLKPLSKRMILVRMLNNLGGIYLENRELLKSLQVLKCICILTPDSAPDVRDRGLLNYQLGNYQEALEDLTKYLNLMPDATDADAINGTVKKLRDNMTNWI
ncbi:MAG: tetratricopeptide repeat protein [Thaumarchaeota archaeon]|nr:tetratricopeptide repeat protein [Nitrososphaerota archaeon]